MECVDVKARQPLRFLLGAALALMTAAACAPREQPPEPPPERPAPSRVPDRAAPTQPKTPTPVAEGDCGPLAADADSAANARTLRLWAWRPFGHRAELGWETYAPRVAHEIGVACPPESVGFVHALARWKRDNGLPDNGRMDEATFLAMKARWQQERPFVRLMAHGACPAPPPEPNLATAKTEEGYSGKIVQLRPRALAAYRRMVAAARAEDPEVFADPQALTIFSAYRNPDADAQRCLTEGNCDGVRRATCSPHRTGLALDLYVGAAPGYGPDSTQDPNRRHQVKTPAYRWLLANAHRFGFVNYPFEPWHWEWTGEAP
jgi:D-alanyl-D-alanine carboxypeptidase